ncbi:MAG: hypothetical protein ACOX5G_09565 [Kiritimatiellia bacterium]
MRGSVFPLFPCLLGAVCLAASCATPPPPLVEGEFPVAVFDSPMDGYERESLAARPVEGDPPEGGIRYWSTPFGRLDCHGCYVSVLNRGTVEAPEWELWENGWGDTLDLRGIFVRRGPSLATLPPYELALSASAIDDVPEPAEHCKLPPREPWRLAEGRGFTRPCVIRDPESGYVLLACVCPDYLPGRVSLFPALATSPDGTPGSWTYRGRLKGEPQEEEIQRDYPVWSDGGTLFRLPGGTWRILLNGFGNRTLVELHAETLDGPWRFLRGGDGAIRELLPHPVTGEGAFPSCFPHVLRVSDSEWHLWLSDVWPCQSIWHFFSEDGLAWRPYGRQPEITRDAVNGHAIKCLRTHLSADGTKIVGLLSVWGDSLPGRPGEKGWTLFRTTLPVGAPPEERSAE